MKLKETMKKDSKIYKINEKLIGKSKLNCVVQELKFSKLLAGNDHLSREKYIRSLKKWIKLRSNSSFPFQKQELLRLWKALFYCMWMSDKPLAQENLSEELASLIHCFDDAEMGITFFGMFLKTMSLEWFGIDQWRIDKFMMLVRRVTRQMFVVLFQHTESNELIDLFNKQLEKYVLHATASSGFLMHFIEIFLEEVAKVSNGNISEEAVSLLIEPYAKYIAKQRNYNLSNHVVKHIFDNLLFQSNLGREYTEKFEFWKQAGCPDRPIDDLELLPCDQDDEDLNENRALDPRAGHIDVYLPEIQFDAVQIIKIFKELSIEQYTNVKSRSIMRKIMNKYNLHSAGNFPLGMKTVKFNKEKLKMPDIDDKVNELIEFEKENFASSNLLKRLNKKKRKKIINSSDVKRLNVKTKKSKKNILSKDIKEKINDWREENINMNLFSNKYESLVSKKSLKPDIKCNQNKEEKQQLKMKLSNDNSGDIQKENDRVNIDVSSKIDKIQSTYKVDKPVKHIKKNKTSDSIVNEKSKKLKINNELTVPDTKISYLSSPTLPLINNKTPTSEKKVKIMLKLNKSQDTNDYIKQLRSSPSVPYDSAKKPSKSLLKPNLIPSPINPYYVKKFGLHFDN